MQVLILDAHPSIEPSALPYLSARNYDITLAGTPGEAFDRIHRTEFDLVLLDVSTTAECMGLLEIRQFVTTSAVGFMTTMPVEALVAEAVAKGRIEFQSFPDLIEHLRQRDQPTMVAVTSFPGRLLVSAKEKGLRVSSARTLQFAMNLLADGWCQIVLLHAEIPGWLQPGKGAIVYHVGSKELAILAAGLSDPSAGIMCRRKPERVSELLAFLQHIAVNQAARCGLAEIGVRPTSDSLG
jgi:CheY-like chemotaxis protein